MNKGTDEVFGEQMGIQLKGGYKYRMSAEEMRDEGRAVRGRE